MDGLKIINRGVKRASHVVTFEEYSKLPEPPYITKQGIKTLYELLATSKELGLSGYEIGLGNQLLRFQYGPDISAYLEQKDISVTEFVESSVLLFYELDKEESPAGKQLAKQKSNKIPKKDINYLKTMLARAVCRLAPPSDTKTITDEMINDGYDLASSVLASICKEDIVRRATEMASKYKIDADTGKIKFKS